QSGQLYKKDADYIRQIIYEFHDRTERLKDSMSGIADSIGTITKVIDDGSNGISNVAGNTKNLADDIDDIAQRMRTNKEVVEGLEKETVVFNNL
ncbi:MAG: methyl-accepting chemotaxis protein, partial [Lachnospiraceae bacterium]|nr:methyl-accepting chemotaxis protein [Lachnospiraceae bacterium]